MAKKVICPMRVEDRGIPQACIVAVDILPVLLFDLHSLLIKQFSAQK
jgi:hypothetical protein